MVNCKISPKFSLVHLSLPDIHAIDAYIFWSLLFSPLSHARLPFLLQRTCLRRFFVIFWWLGTFCDNVIFRYTSKAFPRSTFHMSIGWNINRASFLLFLSYPFEAFFHSMIVTSTKCALFLNSMSSFTITTWTWAAVKI